MKFFKIKKQKNKTIFLINCEIIDQNFMTEIEKHIKPDSKIGLDMKNVKTIKSNKFIEFLLKDKFKLFNLKNEVLIYLFLIMKNGFLKTYLSENDFRFEKREFIKRRFQVA